MTWSCYIFFFIWRSNFWNQLLSFDVLGVRLLFIICCISFCNLWKLLNYRFSYCTSFLVRSFCQNFIFLAWFSVWIDPLFHFFINFYQTFCCMSLFISYWICKNISRSRNKSRFVIRSYCVSNDVCFRGCSKFKSSHLSSLILLIVSTSIWWNFRPNTKFLCWRSAIFTCSMTLYWLSFFRSWHIAFLS